MSNQIYSARYSGVDVYEFIHPTGSIMKRKNDDWVNATHILKAANFAKARRTRILEKEVLKETHEKVQGGFGKYQGTWVPLDLAEKLAKKFNVYDELKSLFDFRHFAGTESPPPAPKHHHTSRADSKKKATKSASMSALTDKKPTKYAATKTDSSITNPTVTRRRGRPPKALQEKRRLAAGTEFQRSQSDMAFSRPNIPNPSIKLNEMIPSRTISEDHPRSNIVQYKQQFKEIDIDDGLSSDIEPQSNDMLDGTRNNDPNRYVSQNILQSSSNMARPEPSLSAASSPSLPTSPSDLSDANPFDQHRFGGIGTSPIVSAIPKYPVQSRPPSSDINDKVNKYLARLVDYFISNEVRSNRSVPQELLSPPPNSVPYIDAPIDPELHTAFHWACSMGNLPIIEALHEVGASPRSINSNGQTPLMRSAIFHNSYTKRTFPRIFQLLHETVFDVDANSQTVIHHIVKRKSTTPSAVYYLEILLSKIKDFAPQYRIELLLNVMDSNGNTALHIAAKNSDKLFFDMLLNNGALSTTTNKEGLTPDEIMNAHYQEQLQLLENQNDINNSPNIKINKSNHDLNLDGSMMSPGDYIIYPSQAATSFSRGLPNIVSSMKDLAEQFNESHKNRENELKSLEKTLKRINTNIKHFNIRTIDTLHNDKNDNIDDSDLLFTSKQNDLEKIKAEIETSKQRLIDDMNKRQSLSLNKYIQNENSTNDSDKENSVKFAVELCLLQESRKRKINNIVGIMEDNLKIHKYRKMISEGTEISIQDVDNCLDVILQTLTTNSK